MQGIHMMPQHMMGQRPLFPAAVQQSVMGHQQQPKPTFPAYSNATISAPPTTNNPASTSTGSSNNNNETQKPPTIPQNTGTASKIIHPPEDISLEELKARRSQYRMNKFSSSVPTSSSASSISVSTAAYVAKANEAKMVAAAHEVSVIFHVLASIFTTFLITFWYMKICLNSMRFVSVSLVMKILYLYLHIPILVSCKFSLSMNVAQY